jgi:hypothetical protein
VIALGQIDDLVRQAAIRQQTAKRGDEEWIHTARQSAGGAGTLDGGEVPGLLTCRAASFFGHR